MIELVFIETPDDLIKISISAKLSDYLVIVTDEKLLAYATKVGVKAQWLRDFLTDPEIDDIESSAWSIARSWHQETNIKSFLEYNGINIGFAYELYFGNYFSWLLHQVLGVKNVLKRYPDARVTVFQSKASVRHSSLFPARYERCVGPILKQLGRTHVVEFSSRGPTKTAISGLEYAKGILRGLFGMCLGNANVKNIHSKPSILVVSAPHHVDTLLPEISKNVAINVLDESFRLAKHRWAKKNYASYFDRDGLKTQLDPKTRTRIASYKTNISNISRHLPITKYQSVDIFQLASSKMQYFFNDILIQSAESVEILTYMLISKNIKAVVVDEDTVAFRKMLANIAAKENIPCFQIAHGCNFEDIQYDLFPVSSKYVFVGSDEIKKYYTARHVNEKKVLVAGIPKYDGLRVDCINSSRDDFLTSVSVKPGSKVVLFGSAPIGDFDIRRSIQERDRAIKDVMTLLKDKSNHYLVLKLHPLDTDTESPLAIAGAMGYKNLRLVTGGSSMPLLSLCDMVISFRSNLVIEAFLCEKSTVIMDYFPRNTSFVPFFNCESTQRVVASDIHSLDRALSFYDNEEVSRQFVLEAKQYFEAWVGGVGSDASSRISNQIVALIGRSGNS